MKEFNYLQKQEDREIERCNTLIRRSSLKGFNCTVNSLNTDSKMIKLKNKRLELMDELKLDMPDKRRRKLRKRLDEILVKYPELSII